MIKLFSRFFYFLSLVLLGLMLLTVSDFHKSLNEQQSAVCALGVYFYWISKILDSNTH